jgi:hypothetical protein
MSESVPISSNSWSPPLNGNESVYPFNSVHKSRSGHIHEIDDTLGAERIHRQHKSGTSETFDATGSRTLTILGDDWITIVKDGHLYIGGKASITIMGDCQTTVEGNYNLRVKNDFNVEVGGKMRTKVNGGGASYDIVGDVGWNISQNAISVIHGSSDRKCMGGESTVIGKDSKTVISGNCSSIVSGNTVNVTNGKAMNVSSGAMTLGAGANMQIGSGSSITINAPGNLNLEAGNLTVADNVNVNGQTSVKGIITSDTDVLSQSVSLISHVHAETGEITLPPTQ